MDDACCTGLQEIARFIRKDSVMPAHHGLKQSESLAEEIVISTTSIDISC
jgi:hypothetical protein